MAGEKARLDVGDEAERNLLPQYAMLDFLTLAPLEGLEHRAPPVLGHPDRAAGKRLEVFRAKLTAGYQRKREPIGENRTDLLHQVQGQRGPARPERVQVAHLGVESHALERRRALGAYQ